MPPNRFESEVESFLEGSHGDRTHIKRADHPRLHHYAGRYSTIGVEVSAGTISTITDAVCDAVLEWQHRPLEAFYPVIYLDAIRIKV